ncbi:hypothetical protein B0O99DRAFT_742105 [Bisporella sp. PMI_857]|nr:hypothetical protein B0O99DRAFT_742105 [Bisporella sp. PMI_857]
MSASDVVKIANLAWEIYRMGWSEEFDASQQYQDFGNDIKSLAENLNNIAHVVENARLTWAQESLRLSRARGPPAPQRDWDLSSLYEIIGDYNKTLTDCRKLLEENYEFRKNRNFAYNIEWNLVIQPKVDYLRRRLDSHNSKISILLKPLELNLLSDIHRDLADRIDAVHRSILHLHGLLIPDIEQAMTEQRRVMPIPLGVPPDIERKFQAAAEKSYPQTRMLGHFPLQAGADAFVTHMKASTKNFTAGNFLRDRTPQINQYIALLKCIYIIRCLHESDELRGAPSDSQWPAYINQLNEDLSVECQRFTTPSAQRLIAPDLGAVIQDEMFFIWPEENIAEYISPHSEVYLEEVLKIPMPSPNVALQRDMTIYRLESTKYRLVETIEDKSTPSARRQEYRMDIDLKTYVLTPIYATPSSRPKSLEVLIHSDSAQTNPTFQDAKHMLRLQNLLTGYKVYERYDQAMVTVQFLVSGKGTPIEEHGRIQLWLPNMYGGSSASTSVTSSAPQSPTRSDASINTAFQSMSLGNNQNFMNSSRLSNRSNEPSMNTTKESLPLDMNRPDGSSSRLSLRSFTSKAKSRRQSSVMTSMSNSSGMSRMTTSSITTISTGTGRAHLHGKPAKPLLVIFLKSKDASAKLSIVAIQIDDATEVKRERCDCRTSNSKCRSSCVERADGYLLCQRWDADQGLGSWNLAKLGVEQRKELPADAWHDVKRVTMNFQSLEDRYKFGGSPCSCRPKMQHDLARCILDGHHGVFGVVRQIGSQRLRNYHQERDKASGRNMVLGSLPEDDM